MKSVRNGWLILGTALVLLAGMGISHAKTAAATAAAARQASHPVVLIVGDSLSAGYGLETGKGWASLLARRMAQQFPAWRVVNASVSGDTTAGGLSRLPALLERDHPAVVIVELGGNDALRGLSLSTTQANLTAMVQQSKAEGARVLLLGMEIPPNYGPAYTQRFAAIFPVVAKAEQVALVPFFLAGVVNHPNWFQADNIHPTAIAQPVMLNTVWPRLLSLLRAVQQHAEKSEAK
ncbi:Esterase TesA [Thiomonas sp. X19]|nr:Esterase TesA [Thiomonas sp. X19]